MYVVCTAASLIRCDEDTHQHELLLEQSDSLHAVLDSLNSLGSFPWTINKRVSTLQIYAHCACYYGMLNDGSEVMPHYWMVAGSKLTQFVRANYTIVSHFCIYLLFVCTALCFLLSLLDLTRITVFPQNLAAPQNPAALEISSHISTSSSQ